MAPLERRAGFVGMRGRRTPDMDLVKYLYLFENHYRDSLVSSQHAKVSYARFNGTLATYI